MDAAGETPIIWPLLAKLSVPLAAQQRPRWTGWRPIPQKPVNRPWHAPRPEFRERDLVSPVFPSVVHELLPKPPTYFRLLGITKDSAGVALSSCVVKMYDTSTDTVLNSVTSDANGAFEFRMAGQPPKAYYLVAYKPGATDVAGTTVNTLQGV